MTIQDPPEEGRSSPGDEPAPAPWHRPELQRFGAVNRATAGISYRPMDGISNLST